MRITQLAGSLLLGTMVMVGCTENTPTELTDTPLFAQGGQGIGAQFVANPFVTIFTIDPDGDFCRAILDPPTDDINDFIRTNPDGSMFIHWSEHASTLRFRTAGGARFLGTGTTTLNSGFAGGFLVPPIRFTASGRVTEQVVGGVTKQAVCRFTSDAKGNVRVHNNALR